MSKKPYNTTQLDPETSFERHVYHRDQFAHYLRWSHVLRRAKIGLKVLDFGCGSGSLCEVFYRNRFKPELYVGLDIRRKTIEDAGEKFKDCPWAQFKSIDLVKDKPSTVIAGDHEWDIIVSFEVAEHVGKNNVPQLLQNIKEQMSLKTTLLISTPAYDENVGAADNHTYDSGDGRGVAVHEMTYDEFKGHLSDAGFKIIDHWGTFASVRDYKPYLDRYPGLDKIYERFHDYFDPNILSNIMAPLFPDKSRNVMWECVLA